jgi:uncharacterized protein (DUF885 family)
MAALLATVAAGAARPAAAEAAAVEPEANALRSLFAASDEAYLKRNPIDALYRGDLRYADQFGDLITDAYFAAERRAAQADLTALKRIDRRGLSPADRLSYDVFKLKREDDLRGLAPEILRARADRPIDHFTGAQIWMADLSSGTGAAPFKTVADYDNNLKRLDGYIVYLDRAIGRMRHGLGAGVTNPKLVMANVVEQLDGLLGDGVEGSIYYKPVKAFPDSISPAERARLTAAYATFIRDRLNPAQARLRDFVQTEYLPKARDSVGLGAMPGGAALYGHLTASITTTSLSPQAIHALGLSEVARIHLRQERLKARAGYTGDLKGFANFLRTDPRFAPKSAEQVAAAFTAIDQRVRDNIGREFSVLPKARLEIRPVAAYREKTEAAAYYEPGTPDGARPGVFYYNTYDLPSRFTWGLDFLFLHEAMPGHHLQTNLAQENTSLPAFQRFGGNSAYIEGWALYAESLGEELNAYSDDYALFGQSNAEMLRAMRLVVDTGIHTLGWSRDQAIAYMLDNSAISRTDATAEVDRYIAMPGDALAYKIGELTIRRLRTKAQTELGSRFDIRAFHAQVLDSGALPMSVLESKINAWVAATKAAPAAKVDH